MAFFFLQLFAFVMFFQPVFVFPALVPLRPYQSSALLALAAYLLAGDKGGKPFLANKYTQFFLLFVTMQIMSASSIWLRAGWEILFVWLNYIIIFFLIVKESTDVHRIRKLSFIIVAALVYLSYDSIRRYEPGVRASGFGWYENANDVVLILVTVIPLVFYLIETSQHKLWRYLYFIIAVLFTINIFLCGSRQGLLGLVIVGIPSLISTKGIPKLFRTSLSVALMIAIFTTGFAVVLQRGDLGGGLTGDESSESRIVQWKACLRMLEDHPILGIGPGESAGAMRDYGGVRGLPPHNTLIQIFAETGIPGGIFFALFTCYPLWQAWKYFRRKKRQGRALSPADMTYRYLIISLTGFWVCAFFSNRVTFSILYVLIAMIVAIQENVFETEVISHAEYSGNKKFENVEA